MCVRLSSVGAELTLGTLCGGHVAGRWSWFDILLLFRKRAVVAKTCS